MKSLFPARGASLPFAAFLVFAAVACNSQGDKPGTTTTTSAEQPMPASAMDNTTPPPAVPAAPAAEPRAARGPVTPSMSKDDGLATSAPIPTTEDTDTEWSKKDGGAPSATPAPMQGTATTSATTTTTTTTTKKPAEAQGKGYGPGAARNNGINSSGPVGNGGGGIR